jgi:hypothetical protein
VDEEPIVATRIALAATAAELAGTNVDVVVIVVMTNTIITTTTTESEEQVQARRRTKRETWKGDSKRIPHRPFNLNICTSTKSQNKQTRSQIINNY